MEINAAGSMRAAGIIKMLTLIDRNLPRHTRLIFSSYLPRFSIVDIEVPKNQECEKSEAFDFFTQRHMNLFFNKQQCQVFKINN